MTGAAEYAKIAAAVDPGISLVIDCSECWTARNAERAVDAGAPQV